MDEPSLPSIADLTRDSHGQLCLHLADGTEHHAVVPVRAFPLAAPREGVALVSPAGKEVCWIENLDQLSQRIAALIEEALALRDFMPRITRLVRVSTFATPSTWQVETDRGPTSFVLKAEEDIRRLDVARLVITDRHGIQYLVEDQRALDANGRKLLDRFL